MQFVRSPPYLPGWNSQSPFNELYFPSTSDRIGVGSPFGEWLWGPNDGVMNGLPATSPDGGNSIASDADPLTGSYGPLITQQVNGLQPGHDYDVSFY